MNFFSRIFGLHTTWGQYTVYTPAEVSIELGNIWEKQYDIISNIREIKDKKERAFQIRLLKSWDERMRKVALKVKDWDILFRIGRHRLLLYSYINNLENPDGLRVA